MPKPVGKNKTQAKLTPMKVETPQKPVEPKVTVFRVFECVVHLEEALAQLKKVGIFPGGIAGRSERLEDSLVTVINLTDSLYKEYLAIWGMMQK